MEKLKITDTTLRDAHQSLIATRMSTAEILPIVDKMDKLGYHSMEVWGGATYDVCIRFLNEDPWERLREIRKRAKNTKLQMLLRAQNLLGYRHYADDLVEKFVQKSIENGIDILRIFDALNDPRNLKKACEATKKYGGHAQLAIAYTISPVHTDEYYLSLVEQFEKMGADSICIKDMSGILLPERAYSLVKKIKSQSALPLQIHSHCTAGIAPSTYVRCMEAGADIVDAAISTFGGGTSQPPIESMLRIFEGERKPDFDMKLLEEVADYFKPIRQKYIDNGMLNHKALFTNPSIIDVQLPGGMLSNLVSQMKSQGAEDRFEEVLKEIPKVREDMGYPPLVTPLSQMVGTQAVMNVLTGDRYKMVPGEIKEYVRGKYGKSPSEISDEMVNKIIPDEERITCRPADFLEAEFEKQKKAGGKLIKNDEDVLTYALFPQVAEKYLNAKYSDGATSFGEDEAGSAQNSDKVKDINIVFG